MSSATAKGFPYLQAGDTLADIPVVIKALADFLDANNGRFKTGNTNIPIAVAGTGVAVPIVFATPYPVGVTPIVVATPFITSGGAATRLVTVSAISRTGFTLNGVNTVNTTAFPAQWIAIG